MFTGLIEEVGGVIALSAGNNDRELKIAAPHLAKKMRRGDSVAVNGCVAPKGSIAVNGISLTVAEILPTSFLTWIIPYTKKHTNLDRAKPGDLMSLEFDILAKYLERMLSPFVVKK